MRPLIRLRPGYTYRWQSRPLATPGIYCLMLTVTVDDAMVRRLALAYAGPEDIAFVVDELLRRAHAAF